MNKDVYVNGSKITLLQTDMSMFVCVFVRLFYATGNGAQEDKQQ